jgi:hypothetical protein
LLTASATLNTPMPTIEPSHLNSVRLLPAYFHPLGSVQSNGGFRETKLLSVMTEIEAFPDRPLLIFIQSVRMTETGWFSASLLFFGVQ